MDGPPPEGTDPGSARPPSRSSRSRLLRALVGVAGIAVVVYLLFTVVFPWFQEYQDDPTLEGSAATVAVAHP